MTTRQLMSFIAVVAVVLTLLPWLCRETSQHPYYFANRAAQERRHARWARQQAASARASAEDWRRKARGAHAVDRDRFETAAKRHEEYALPRERLADELSQDAVENFKKSRKSGYIPSELPERIRREMEPEELDW
jgi:hypothetical protein